HNHAAASAGMDRAQNLKAVYQSPLPARAPVGVELVERIAGILFRMLLPVAVHPDEYRKHHHDCHDDGNLDFSPPILDGVVRGRFEQSLGRVGGRCRTGLLAFRHGCLTKSIADFRVRWEMASSVAPELLFRRADRVRELRGLLAVGTFLERWTIRR